MATRELQRIAQAFPPSFAPRDHRLFSGVVGRHGMPLWGRAFYRLTGGAPGDHRDWADITRWAGDVAGQLPATHRRGTDICS
jgi:menaquinone-dependent protoporphyrinogen oxidase